MKIILSPAKKMKIFETNTKLSKPLFIDEAKKIYHTMMAMSYEKLKELWVCNDKIAVESYRYLKLMDFENNLSPAIYTYNGIQYQYLAAHLLEDEYLEYLKNNVYILSGFYGLLRAFDAINLYRLEMQAKLKIDNQNIYEFYGEKVFKVLTETNEVIINLASKEYSKLVETKMSDYPFINIEFVEKLKDKYVSKGVRVKMARGAMARYIIENKITNPELIKDFKQMGYCFSEDLSNDRNFVFELIK